MLNKNVADYTDFTGKTNKKIVQAPGGNSSISFYWGDIKPNNNSVPISHSSKEYSQHPHNPYSHFPTQNSEIKPGGPYTHNSKPSNQMRIMNEYQKPSDNLRQSNYYGPNIRRSDIMTPESKIMNSSQNYSKLYMPSHKAGSYINYANNRGNQQSTQMQNPEPNLSSNFPTNNNLSNSESIYKNSNLAMQNDSYFNQKLYSQQQHHHDKNPSKNFSQKQMQVQKNSIFKEQHNRQLNRNNIYGQVQSTNVINQQESRNVQKQRGRQIVYSREYSRPYPVENKANKYMLQKSADKLQKLDQIDIALKETPQRKYPQNIHSHPNHQRNSVVPKSSPKKLRNVSQSKSESVQNKPCIRMTATAPKNHIIFGDPSYNYWKDREIEHKKQESASRIRDNSQIFGKRVQVQDSSSYRKQKYLMNRGKQNLVLE